MRHTALRRFVKGISQRRLGFASRHPASVLIAQYRRSIHQTPLDNLDQQDLLSGANNARVEPLLVQAKPSKTNHVGTRITGESVCHDIQDGVQTEILKKRSFQEFKDNFSSDVFEAITENFPQYTHTTPVQTAILSRLPGLVEMSSEQPRPSERKDILAISAKSEDSQIAYLVSAIEAAQKLQQAAVFNHDTADEQVERISMQSQVGTLIIVPSGMYAMDIAKKAGLLLGEQGATMPLDVKLLTDGQKEHAQREEWTKGGRDVVIATPDRLRYLLMTEPSMGEAFRYTQLLILDRTNLLMEKSLRDDVDAIVNYLPKNLHRQTFIFTEEMSFAIKQLSARILNPDHLVIDAAPELKVKFSQVSQVYTVLPNANHQLPYLVKLLAHDQLKYPKRSKVVVFCTTTRMAQLLTRLVETSRAMCLPGGESTRVYSLHPLVAIQDRATSISDFIENKGCSVLITADTNLQTTPLGSITRIIQLGVPSSDPVYYSRVQQAAQSPTRDKRVDLVLLPWQTGYLTCNLMDAPLSPVDIEQFHREMAKLAKKADVKSLVDGIEDKVQALLPNLPEEEILSAFVSLLGYYVPRCNDLRVQRSTVVRGITDWATGACRLLRAPFISEDYLNRLQELDKVKG